MTRLDLESGPMAPSSALISLAYGLILVGSAGKKSPFWGRVLLGLAFVPVILAACNWLDIHLAFEHLGFALPNHPGELTRVGHVTPLVAGGFCLVSLAYCIACGGIPLRRWRLHWVGLLSGFVIVMSTSVAFAYLSHLAFLFQGLVFPVAFPTSLALLSLALSVVALEWPEFTGDVAAERYPIAAGKATALLTVLGMGVSFFVFKNYVDYYRTWAERDLSSIADFKMAEIIHWRWTRHLEGEILKKNPTFIRLVKQYFQGSRGVETAACKLI